MSGIPATLAELRVPIASLRPYARNPRRGSLEAIKRSLEANGQYRPIVVRQGTGEVLAGNHTLAAAVELGWQEIAATFIDVGDEEAARIVLVDNRTSDLAVYDDAEPVELLESLPELDGTGWEQDDFARLLASLDGGAGRDTEPAQVPAEPVSRPGDLWQLGGHRLLCGDATDPGDFARLMAGETADLVWMDPPYGVAYAGKNEMLNATGRGNRIQVPMVGDHGTPDELEALLRRALGLAREACRPGAVWFVAAPCQAQPLRAFVLVLCELEVWRNTIVWVKDGHVLGRSDYHGQHEHLLYGWVPGAAHTPPPSRSETSVWECPRPRANALHPTSKPVALVERSLLNHTGRGANVLDPFAGSGSTLIAAENLGRRCYALEIDPGYCDVTVDRWERHTGRQAQLVEEEARVAV